MSNLSAAEIKALKKEAAQKAVEFIKDGMLLGLGSGSTSEIALEILAQKVKEGLNIKGIPSSKQVEDLAIRLGIPLTSFEEVDILDVNIDGADEVDPNYNLIKGGGGALLREKVNAFAAKTNIIMVDSRKMVSELGAFPLPIELNVFGHQQVKRIVEKQYGITTSFRMAGDVLFVSDNGNYILNCHFKSIPDPAALDKELKNIPGVLETGLFIDLLHVLVLATEKGVEVQHSNS